MRTNLTTSGRVFLQAGWDHNHDSEGDSNAGHVLRRCHLCYQRQLNCRRRVLRHSRSLRPRSGSLRRRDGGLKLPTLVVDFRYVGNPRKRDSKRRYFSAFMNRSEMDRIFSELFVHSIQSLRQSFALRIIEKGRQVIGIAPRGLTELLPRRIAIQQGALSKVLPKYAEILGCLAFRRSSHVRSNRLGQRNGRKPQSTSPRVYRA